MKASLSWLKKYVDINIPVNDLAEMLTMAGLHVDYIEQKGNDYCVEFEITSNRNDCLSVMGIAREIAAITGKKLKIPARLNDKAQTTNAKGLTKLRIQIKNKKLCPRYTGRIITGVKAGPSPKWLQDKLISIGMRPVNNIVDITNFVLMETGQPMHAFDLDKIKGDIIVRAAEKGESIKTIDGKAQTLEAGMLVIADEKAPIAVAGVMGGLETEVSNNTKNILLESAYFDSVSVRSASRRLGLSSESSYRFERKVDKGLVLAASNRAAFLAEEIADGKIGRLIDTGVKTAETKKVKFNPKKSNEILGVNIPLPAQKKILKTLGFFIKGAKNNLQITVPGFRSDVSLDVDITEEIARIYNYGKIPDTIPKIIGNTTLMDKKALVRKEIKRCLFSSGLSEIMTYNMIASSLLKDFLKDKSETASIINPLSKEQEVLTASLLPGMLKTINYNINRKNKNLALFEIGKVYRKQAKAKYEETTNLSIALTGLAENNWLSEKRKTTLFDLKGIVINLFERLGLSDVIKFNTQDDTSYLNAVSEIQYMGASIGLMGKMDSNVAKKFDIDEDVYISEISLEKILKEASLEKRFRPIPKFPAITRDISLLADKSVKAEQIVSIIKEIGFPVAKKAYLIDMYKGREIPKDKKALLYRVEYRDDTKTLVDSEVEELHNKIRQTLADKLGISFR